MILALLVFILTYALISIRRFKKFRIDRPTTALILGAVANIIVAETGSVMGIEIGFWKFMKVGIIVTVLTLILSILMLSLI